MWYVYSEEDLNMFCYMIRCFWIARIGYLVRKTPNRNLIIVEVCLRHNILFWLLRNYKKQSFKIWKISNISPCIFEENFFPMLGKCQKSVELRIDTRLCGIGHTTMCFSLNIHTHVFRVFIVWIKQHISMCKRYTLVYFWGNYRKEGMTMKKANNKALTKVIGDETHYGCV